MCVLQCWSRSYSWIFDAWTEQSKLVLRTPVNLKTLFENVKSVSKATVMEVSVDETDFDHHSGVGRSCCLLTVSDGAFLLLSYPVSLFCEQNLYHPMQRSRKTLMEDFSFFLLEFTAWADLLNHCRLILQAHSNETVGSVRWKIAKMLNSPVDNIQIFANDSLVC